MIKILLISISLSILSLIYKNFLINFLITLNIFIYTIIIFFLNNFLNNYWYSIYYIFGLDNLRISLIILTFWISALSILRNIKLIKLNLDIKFIQLFIFIILIIIITFISINFLIFYIFFESRLIPIILIIIGWGYQIDRIQARIYIIFYTLFGSLPLLILLIYLNYNVDSLIFNILILINYLNFDRAIYFSLLNIAFLIKIPIYLVHLWLPKAHVEAPISGSIILAGVILKLGSYGLYRNIFIFPQIFVSFINFIILISLLGSLISRLICLNQSDLKIIIAYSSIVHINLIISGIITLFIIRLKRRILFIIAHGLCSSGIFLIVNYNYERNKSRNIFINKGIINILPTITLWWFLICSSNFSAPPSLNLIREILILNRLIQWNYFLILLSIIIFFFRTCYSIFLYAFSQYGKFNLNFFNFFIINCNEYNLILIHWIPLNIIFFNFNLFIF